MHPVPDPRLPGPGKPRGNRMPPRLGRVWCTYSTHFYYTHTHASIYVIQLYVVCVWTIRAENSLQYC